MQPRCLACRQRLPVTCRWTTRHLAILAGQQSIWRLQRCRTGCSWGQALLAAWLEGAQAPAARQVVLFGAFTLVVGLDHSVCSVLQDVIVSSSTHAGAAWHPGCTSPAAPSPEPCTTTTKDSAWWQQPQQLGCPARRTAHEGAAFHPCAECAADQGACSPEQQVCCALGSPGRAAAASSQAWACQAHTCRPRPGRLASGSGALLPHGTPAAG